jgi:hypothetical protein
MQSFDGRISRQISVIRLYNEHFIGRAKKVFKLRAVDI